MKAIAYSDDKKLQSIEIPVPSPQGHELLVEIKAVAVNPVDIKVRQLVTPEPGQYKILGWDAAGIVRETGGRVTLFKPGDEVWYAGSIAKDGCFSEFHLVDERITGLKPKSLNYAESAALPLTSITAWELLFDRLHVQPESSGSLLIIGAAGGVGSILTQLAHSLTELTVIGTASRPESRDWVYQMGADHVIDHHQPFLPQLNALGIDAIDNVANLTHTDQHFKETAECLAPQGKLALIDDPQQIDITLLKQKSISLHWEFMYTRPLFNTDDMIKQHQLLNQVSELIDSNQLHTTLQQRLNPISKENIEKAFNALASGHTHGKIVLEGWLR